MDEYLLRNCDTGRIQPAGEEAILEKVLERGRGRGTRPGSSPSYRPGAGVPAQLRVARLPQRQQASAVINYNYNSSEVGGVVW